MADERRGGREKDIVVADRQAVVRDRRLLPSLPDHKLINHNRLTVRHYFGQIKDSRTNLCRPWTEKLRPTRSGRIVDGCCARAVRQPTDWPTDRPTDGFLVDRGWHAHPARSACLPEEPVRKKARRSSEDDDGRTSKQLGRSVVRPTAAPVAAAAAAPAAAAGGRRAGCHGRPPTRDDGIAGGTDAVNRPFDHQFAIASRAALTSRLHRGKQRHWGQLQHPCPDCKPLQLNRCNIEYTCQIISTPATATKTT